MDELESSRLIERAVIAAKQMRYFRLFIQRASFDELRHSTDRAKFAVNYEDVEHREASFRWAVGEPDFLFFVSFENPARISVFAEAYGDIFGLIMLSHSRLPNISVDIRPGLETPELGPNALRFRDILLKFPDFDGGTEEMRRRLGL